LTQPAYNTVYCDHAAFETDDKLWLKWELIDIS